MNIQNAAVITLSHEETVAALLEGIQKKYRGKIVAKDADLSKIKVHFEPEFLDAETTTGKLTACEITLPPVTQTVGEPAPESTEA